jgi:uncharacterized membrane protein YkoI
MKITFRWLTFLAITLSASAWAGDPGITLEEAVAKVQKDTGGKVLSADTILHERGKTTEYRLKVLTPDGHVRVVPVRTETSKIPDATDRDTKEKH